MNSCACIWSSRRLMRLTITDGATPAWRAAAEKLPARAVARKALMFRSVSIRLSPFEKDDHAKLFDSGEMVLGSNGFDPVAGVCSSARERHDGRAWRPLAEPARDFGDPACEDVSFLL